MKNCCTVIGIRRCLVVFVLLCASAAGCTVGGTYSKSGDVRQDLQKAAMLTTTAIDEFNKRNYVVAEELCRDALDLRDDFYQSQLGCAKVFFELSMIRKDPSLCEKAAEHCERGVDLLVSREDISCRMGHKPQPEYTDRAFSLLSRIRTGCAALQQ